MRKLVGLLASLAMLGLSGTALAGPAATNGNGDFLAVNVNVTPPVSATGTAPQGVGVVFDSFAGNRVNAGQEANATSIKVHFDQGFVDNGLRFPSCAVNPTALTVCPPSTRYGHGTAEGELFSSPGGPPTYVTAALSGYNGKPYQSKDPTEIIIASVAGKPTLELDFRVSREHGGLSFTEIHFPPAPGGTPGPRVSLARFHLIIPDRSEVINVHGKKRTIHLLQAPAVCHGSWTFSQTNTLANLPPLVATDSQPCSKR